MYHDILIPCVAQKSTDLHSLSFFVACARPNKALLPLVARVVLAISSGLYHANRQSALAFLKFHVSDILCHTLYWPGKCNMIRASHIHLKIIFVLRHFSLLATLQFTWPLNRPLTSCDIVPVRSGRGLRLRRGCGITACGSTCEHTVSILWAYCMWVVCEHVSMNERSLKAWRPWMMRPSFLSRHVELQGYDPGEVYVKQNVEKATWCMWEIVKLSWILTLLFRQGCLLIERLQPQQHH